MITYSTNFMGPVSMEWFRERGLTEEVTQVITEDSVLVELGRKNVGDVLEYEEVTTHYCAGRIDIRDDEKLGYDGWNEYSLPPMHGEDWNDFSDWLESFQTYDLWKFDDIIAQYKDATGRKIRWADDIWLKCHYCHCVTDLRVHDKQLHKMSCDRNWK